MGKKMNKHLLRMIQDYSWIMGLSLVAASIIQTTAKPHVLFFSGMFFAGIAVVILAWNSTRDYDYVGTLRDEEGNVVGKIVRE